MSVSDTSPQSASAVTALLSMRTGALAEPLDCSTPPVLDLCTRPRSHSRSPCPEGARQSIKSPDTATYLDYQVPTGPAPLIFRPKHMPVETDSSEEGSVISETMSEFTPYPLTPSLGSLNPRSKPTRPFKAYPKDPFFLAIGASTADAILGKESAGAYAEFRQKMLLQVQANNPPPGVTNAKMRRSSLPTSTQDCTGKDASYWEKRKKNNEAAKRSRDARRAKEDEIAIRAAFLEQENLKLKYEIATLRNETNKLRCLLYN